MWAKNKRASFTLNAKDKQKTFEQSKGKERGWLRRRGSYIFRYAHLDITSRMLSGMRCMHFCKLQSSILEMCKSKSKIASSIFYYRFAKNYRCVVFCVACTRTIISIVFNGVFQRNMLLQWIYADSVAAAIDVKMHGSDHKIVHMRVRACERDVKMKSFKCLCLLRCFLRAVAFNLTLLAILNITINLFHWP